MKPWGVQPSILRKAKSDLVSQKPTTATAKALSVSSNDHRMLSWKGQRRLKAKRAAKAAAVLKATLTDEQKRAMEEEDARRTAESLAVLSEGLGFEIRNLVKPPDATRPTTSKKEGGGSGGGVVGDTAADGEDDEDAAQDKIASLAFRQLPHTYAMYRQRNRLMSLSTASKSQRTWGSGSGSGSGDGRSTTATGGALGAADPFEAYLPLLIWDTPVKANEFVGRIRYVGAAPFGDGLWCGLELLDQHYQSTPLCDYGVKHYTTKTISSLTNALPATITRGSGLEAFGVLRNETGTGAAETEAEVQQTMKQREQWRKEMGYLVGPHAATSGLGDGQSAAARKLAVRAALPHCHAVNPSLLPYFDMIGVPVEKAYFVRIDAVRPLKSVVDERQNAAHRAKHERTQTERQRMFSAIDDWVITGVPALDKNSVEDVALYLTTKRSLLTYSPIQKLRAIFRWICHRITYVPITNSNDPADVIRKRKANAEGFANLFQALCEVAGFDTIKIHGYDKQSGYTVGDTFHRM